MTSRAFKRCTLIGWAGQWIHCNPEHVLYCIGRREEIGVRAPGGHHRPTEEEMEVCEDMAVDLEVVNMRKRQCMDGILDHSLNKRTCHGLQSMTNGNDVLLSPMADCDMTYWQMEVSNGRREPVNGFILKEVTQPTIMPQQNHQSVIPPQICQRCMAGESGHINHILGL